MIMLWSLYKSILKKIGFVKKKKNYFVTKLYIYEKYIAKNNAECVCVYANVYTYP